MVKFIKKLQNADEFTKQRWLWGLTTIFSLLVIFFWLLYLNARVVSIDGVPGSNSLTINRPSFFATLAAGLITMREEVTKGLNVILKENLIQIAPREENFIFYQLEPIPVTALP